MRKTRQTQAVNAEMGAPFYPELAMGAVADAGTHSLYVTKMSIERIVSGGQTGVDRAALDLASEIGIDAGGWVPKGRLAEDGPLPERYRMTESPSDDPAQRTEWNVRDSDATLIVSDGKLASGSALTAEIAERLARPCFHADLSKKAAHELVGEIAAWLEAGDFKVLNIAGPRASDDADIYDKARAVLRPVLVGAKMAL